MGGRGLMRLWRLCSARHAQSFDGGYGLLYDGRWNSVGHAVTYCSTSPSLCVLEKLVHVEDPLLLPKLVMVTYGVPDDLATRSISLDDLSADWRGREGFTQELGNVWHRSLSTPILRVPSAIVPLKGSPDVNVLINHKHPGVAEIKLISAELFVFDPRLL
ncbi:MAG: RES family NAD+ phosphorylase [Alphaproteobacteria bacterium]